MRCRGSFRVGAVAIDDGGEKWSGFGGNKKAVVDDGLGV